MAWGGFDEEKEGGEHISTSIVNGHITVAERRQVHRARAVRGKSYGRRHMVAYDTLHCFQYRSLEYQEPSSLHIFPCCCMCVYLILRARLTGRIPYRLILPQRTEALLRKGSHSRRRVLSVGAVEKGVSSDRAGRRAYTHHKTPPSYRL